MDGKVALVTGAGAGIGRATAMLFAQKKAKVIVADTNTDAAAETVGLIKASGGEASYVICNVSIESEVAAMVQKAVELYGSLDFAFNNAGIGPDGKRIPMLSIDSYTEEVWDKMMNVNIKGALFCMKYEILQMKKQKTGGVIINSSSSSYFQPSPGFGAYVASKTGIVGLSKVAALENADVGIRVNAICPGPTNTQLMKTLAEHNPGEIDHVKAKIPMHRLGEPIDIARAVVWLCSDDASFITGIVLPVDGGLTAG